MKERWTNQHVYILNVITWIILFHPGKHKCIHFPSFNSLRMWSCTFRLNAQKAQDDLIVCSWYPLLIFMPPYIHFAVSTELLGAPWGVAPTNWSLRNLINSMNLSAPQSSSSPAQPRRTLNLIMPFLLCSDSHAKQQLSRSCSHKYTHTHR